MEEGEQGGGSGGWGIGGLIDRLIYGLIDGGLFAGLFVGLFDLFGILSFSLIDHSLPINHPLHQIHIANQHRRQHRMIYRMIEHNIIENGILTGDIHLPIYLHLFGEHSFIDLFQYSGLPVHSAWPDDCDPEGQVEEIIGEGEVVVVGVEEDAGSHGDYCGLQDGGGEFLHCWSEGLMMKVDEGFFWDGNV